MKHLPPPRADLNRIANERSRIVSALRLLPFIALLTLALVPVSSTQAQTITIYNESGQPFSLNPFIAVTCTPPGSQQTACITVTAGNSNTYTPPTGYVWYGFKIYCGTNCFSFPVVGSTSCAGGRPFDCGGTTYNTSVDGNEVRIYE